MIIRSLPAAFQASQARFGPVHGSRVEIRRGGVEDVFQNVPDRWAASFVIEPRLADMPQWRLLLRQLQGAAGLVYVHDASNPAPEGGARTADAFAAALAAGLVLAWEDEDGAGITWEDSGGAAVAWDEWPAVPAVRTLRLAAAAAAGAEAVTVSGLWPEMIGVIRAGDYIQVEHWLYLATEDAVSDADGVASVAISPPLWRAAPYAATVRLECAATLMRLDQAETLWGRGPRERRSPFSLRFIEVLPTEGVPD